MSDVFREVDEEVRRDRAAEYWKKHGNLLIGITILIVGAVGGWRFYDTYRFNQRAAAGAGFESAIAALGSGKPEALNELTALAAKKDGAYPILARFRLASEIAAKADDDTKRKDAISAFDALASDATLSAEWRDLARLRAGFVLVDSGSFADVDQRLSPLVTASGNFRHSAREGIALSAWRNGDNAKALDALQAIILDADTPSALRQRAELLLAVVRSGANGKG